MTSTILHIDASARGQDSVTRDLTARIVANHPEARVISRDLAAKALPPLTEDWVAANYTPADSRTDAQRQTLALSDALVGELQDADTVVIGLPVYNFGVPAALKTWIDHIARVGVTFKYTDEGAQGLMKGKRAIIAMASGGTGVDSPIDFATPYIRHILGFIGITDVTVVAADGMNIEPDASLEKALSQLAALPKAA